MKQKDVALILVIVIVSGLMSFFLARAIFATSKNRQMQAQIVSPITTDFVVPSTKYFNENSINPTQQIQIGNSVNDAPYNGQ